MDCEVLRDTWAQSQKEVRITRKEGIIVSLYAVCGDALPE